MRVTVLATALVGAIVGGRVVGQTVDWPVRVLDSVTFAGVPNAKVSARQSGVDGVTDANGNVVLTVKDGREDLLVVDAVNGSHSYTLGNYPTTGPRTVYLVPDAAFHRTPIIPVSGTNAPIVFQGVTKTVMGANPYTIEIEVPANVLPCPAEFWIAPVPSFASPSPVGADAVVASAIAQFAVDLKDATGKSISKVLPAPGITVRFTPMWYSYGLIAQHAAPVKGVQYRLTQTSQRWDPQQESVVWDPGTGVFTGHLRACSWWVVLFFAPFLAGDSQHPPIQPPAPPPPDLVITPSACVKSDMMSASFVHCGRISGSPVSVTAGNNGKVTISAGVIASLTGTLSLAPGDIARFLTRLNASISGHGEMNASGGFEIDLVGGNAGALNPGDGGPPGCQCYSGEARLSIYKREYTASVGANSVTFSIPQGIMKVYCLELDPTCGENCSGPYKKQVISPSSLSICAGDLMLCQ